MELLKLDKIILPCSKTLSFPEIHRLHVLSKQPDGSQEKQVWVLQSEFKQKLLVDPSDKEWTLWLERDAAQQPMQDRCGRAGKWCKCYHN